MSLVIGFQNEGYDDTYPHYVRVGFGYVVNQHSLLMIEESTLLAQMAAEGYTPLEGEIGDSEEFTATRRGPWSDWTYFPLPSSVEHVASHSGFSDIGSFDVSPDGLKMIMSRFNDTDFLSYDLASPYAFSNRSNFNFRAKISSSKYSAGIFFRPDGAQAGHIAREHGTIQGIPLDNFSIYAGSSTPLSGSLPSMISVDIRSSDLMSDGETLICIDGGRLHTVSYSDPLVPSSYSQSTPTPHVNLQSSDYQGCGIDENDKLFVAVSNTDVLEFYHFETPGDLQTLEHLFSVEGLFPTGTPFSPRIVSAQKKVFVCDRDNGTIEEFTYS